MGKVYVFDHPLIQHKTAMIRKTDTSVKDFRELVREIAMLMGYEATRDLPLQEVEIETPICAAKVNMLKGEDIAIVPILRAGLGLVDGLLELVPNAKVAPPLTFTSEASAITLDAPRLNVPPSNSIMFVPAPSPLAMVSELVTPSFSLI